MCHERFDLVWRHARVASGRYFGPQRGTANFAEIRFPRANLTMELRVQSADVGEAIAREIKIIERAMKSRMTEMEVMRLSQPAVHGQGAGHQSAGARVGKDTHGHAEGNLSIVGEVLSAARLQAESTDRGFSRRVVG